MDPVAGQTSRFGCFVGVFEQDQHERRETLFHARHWRHCHVSDEVAVEGYVLRRAIAAPQDQQIVSSASLATAQ